MGRWEHGREIGRKYMHSNTKFMRLTHIDYEDWHCSKCQYVVKQSNKPEWNYCPNCGDYKGNEEENNKEPIPYLMHKEMDISLLECQKAYDIAMEYLRNQAKLKG